MGVDRETAFRVAGGFGGGMGRMAGTCGAVTGAFMAIGMKYGMTDPAQTQDKEATYEKVRGFAAAFKRRFGSLICKDLLGCDIGTPEGSDYAHAHGLFKTRCAELVRGGVEILEAVL